MKATAAARGKQGRWWRFRSVRVPGEGRRRSQEDARGGGDTFDVITVPQETAATTATAQVSSVVSPALHAATLLAAAHRLAAAAAPVQVSSSEGLSEIPPGIRSKVTSADLAAAVFVQEAAATASRRRQGSPAALCCCCCVLAGGQKVIAQGEKEVVRKSRRKKCNYSLAGSGVYREQRVAKRIFHKKYEAA